MPLQRILSIFSWRWFREVVRRPVAAPQRAVEISRAAVASGVARSHDQLGAGKGDRVAEPVEGPAVACPQLLNLHPSAAGISEDIDGASVVVHADSADDGGVAGEGNRRAKRIVKLTVTGGKFLCLEPTKRRPRKDIHLTPPLVSADR